MMRYFINRIAEKGEKGALLNPSHSISFTVNPLRRVYFRVRSRDMLLFFNQTPSRREEILCKLDARRNVLPAINLPFLFSPFYSSLECS